jgi:hypothetical protein
MGTSLLRGRVILFEGAPQLHPLPVPGQVACCSITLRSQSNPMVPRHSPRTEYILVSCFI